MHRSGFSCSQGGRRSTRPLISPCLLPHAPGKMANELERQPLTESLQVEEGADRGDYYGLNPPRRSSGFFEIANRCSIALRSHSISLVTASLIPASALHNPPMLFFRHLPTCPPFSLHGLPASCRGENPLRAVQWCSMLCMSDMAGPGIFWCQTLVSSTSHVGMVATGMPGWWCARQP